MYIGKRGAIVKIASKQSSCAAYVAVAGRVGLTLNRDQIAAELLVSRDAITIYKPLKRHSSIRGTFPVFPSSLDVSAVRSSINKTVMF